jgi:hypothetical protein
MSSPPQKCVPLECMGHVRLVTSLISCVHRAQGVCTLTLRGAIGALVSCKCNARGQWRHPGDSYAGFPTSTPAQTNVCPIPVKGSHRNSLHDRPCLATCPCILPHIPPASREPIFGGGQSPSWTCTWTGGGGRCRWRHTNGSPQIV